MKRLKPSAVGTPRPLLSLLSSSSRIPLRRPMLTKLTPNRYRYCSSHAAAAESLSVPATPPPTTTTTTAAQNATNKTLHHTLATAQSIYGIHEFSPGSPLFLPNGTRIFNRLIEFLRAQYALYGYEEVLTPTIYKDKLWEQSGHLKNFRDDMFKVISAKKTAAAAAEAGHDKDKANEELEEYSLKPMNCPGHCLLYKMRGHGHHELPLRFAEFAPLHRDEIRSALTGLTRVRRFHQDDAHIFCRHDQIAQEIAATLSMIETVYSVFSLQNYKFVLSTRPDNYMGTIDEWTAAEESLKQCLDASGKSWTLNEGDGAFYGPKIDIILTDSAGKEHQTATVQLDFQLPHNFELKYDASEAGRTETPVIIHRAVFGSLERFMALLIEKFEKRWPFWISPRQVKVIPVNGSDEVMRFAKQVRDTLAGVQQQQPGGTNTTKDGEGKRRRQALGKRTFFVDLEENDRAGLSKKIRMAKSDGYNILIIVGNKEVESGKFAYEIWRGGRYVEEKELSSVEEFYGTLVEMESEYL
ncbi:hypothetical protein H072_3484 [Dactylellina haptotyla CBS 200.50]|uniref:threonine--tRNA ligase n=1 Tax=Dactylellina haptotyla (strain CBS 200.50) TaxID=1284197 RepID=S8AI45_DACHA|nr:hypothetical protein H072_3484 [Dactylellina haptotyla CBS 200.50]